MPRLYSKLPCDTRRYPGIFYTVRSMDMKKLLGGLLSLILHPRNRDDLSYLRRYAAFFPHVRFDRLRPGDAIRIPLQLLWLALVRAAPLPISPRWMQRNGHWPAKLRQWLTGNVMPMILRRAGQLHSRVEEVADRFRQIGEGYAKNRCWDYRAVRYLSYGTSALLVFLCIATPLDAFDQLAFSAFLLAIALIARLASGEIFAYLLAGLSVIVSSRYFWWRASSTLSLDGNLEFAWGLALLAAEFYAWLILLAGYFETCWPVKRSSAGGLIRAYDEPANSAARIIFLTAPLAFLLFDAYIIYAPAALLALYALPHMAHAALAGQRVQGAERFSFLAVAYKTVLSWCAARHGMAMLFGARKTAPDAVAEKNEDKFDLNTLTPFILLIGFNLAGLVAGLYRLYLNPQEGAAIIWLNLVWVFYNLLFLGATVTVILKFNKNRTDSMPKYGLRMTLNMCFMGYYHMGELFLLCASLFARSLSRPCMIVGSYLPRSPKLSSE